MLTAAGKDADRVCVREVGGTVDGYTQEAIGFPELAFTTFFPRWWMDDQREVDAKYFEKSMPSKDTTKIWDSANATRWRN